jgi:hypothetical protein
MNVAALLSTSRHLVVKPYGKVSYFILVTDFFVERMSDQMKAINRVKLSVLRFSGQLQ